MVTRRAVTVGMRLRVLILKSQVLNVESCVTLGKILRVGRSVVTLTNCDILAEVLPLWSLLCIVYPTPIISITYVWLFMIIIISGNYGLMGLLASPLTVESQCLFNLCPFVSLLTLNFSSSFRTFKIYCSDCNGRIRIQTVYKAHVNEQFGKLVDQLTSIFPLYEQLL